MNEVAIQREDPRTPDVMALLRVHLDFAREVTPPEDVHALDVDALAGPGISLFSLRGGGELLAVGALRHLDTRHAEIKSMHTAAHARGSGIGRRILEHLVRVARDRGYERVSLETGTMEAFAPARAMYRRYGFAECEPFGEYQVRPNSVCMTLRLGPRVEPDPR